MSDSIPAHLKRVAWPTQIYFKFGTQIDDERYEKVRIFSYLLNLFTDIQVLEVCLLPQNTKELMLISFFFFFLKNCTRAI